MFGGSKEQTNDPLIGGTEEEEISTTQESVPVPYLAGTRKVAARWLSNVYNQFTREIQVDLGKKGSKKSGSKGSGTYDYFGSLAAAVCNGAVDELVAVIIDGQQRWANPDQDADRETYPDKYVGTIAGYGVFHFYWGTDTQTIDSTSILKSANNDKAENHPEYKGTAIIELRDFLFGREKVSAPNIEVVVRRKPQQNLVSGDSSLLDDGEANPVTAVAELFTNKRFGLGMDDALFDSDSFQDVSDYIATNKQLTYCSPFANKQETMRSFLSDATAITDTFIKWDSGTAKIQAGYWPHDDSVNTALLPVIEEEDQTEPPSLTSEGWAEVKTGWDVSFADRERMYKESSEKFDDLSMLKLTGQPNRESLSRDWITRREQALAHAKEWSRMHTRPYFGGEIIVRRRSMEGIEVGDLFMLDIDAEPSGSQIRQPFRLLEKSYNPSGAITCQVEAETGIAPTAYTPPAVLTTDDTGFPEPSAFTYVRPVELPISYSGQDYGVAVLAQRQENLTTGYNVLYDDSLAGDFPTLGTQRFFAVYATLSGTFSATAKGADEVGYVAATDAPNLDITNSNFTDLTNLPDSLGLAAARDDQLILMLMEIDSGTGQIALDSDGYANMEMLSVSAIVANLDETRQIQAIRSRFSTGKREFPLTPGNTVEAWLVRKSSLESYTHEDFAGAASGQTDVYFKTEPFNIFQTRDISEDGHQTFLFAQNRFFAPKISATVANSGFVGVPLTISGTITDQDGDLASFSVSWRVAGAGTENETVLLSGPVEPTTSYAFQTPVTFTAAGSYEVVVRAQDSTSFVDGYVEEVYNVSISVTQSALSPPANFKASDATVDTPARQNAIWLEWDATADVPPLYVDFYEIFESTTNDSSTASLVITTGALFASFPVEDTDNHYFWIRAVDSALNRSALTPGQTSGEVGNAIAVAQRDFTVNPILNTEIADDAISTPKIQANAIVAGHIGTNEIIANTANIKDAVITNAKISDLSAAKLTAGTINAQTITMGTSGGNGIIQSAGYDGAGTGWQIKGDGTADIANLIVRGNATVSSGTSNTIQSANYVSGTSGWLIRGDGYAEFWDVNIYGSVPIPQVFAGATELESGLSTRFGFAASVTLTISSAAGTTAYYRTDGQVPTGQVSEQVPAGGEITLTMDSIDLRVISIETATGRSSPTFSAGIDISVPYLCNSLGTTGMRFRFFKQQATYLLVGFGNPLLGAGSVTTWTQLTISDFTDVNGNPYGFQTSLWSPGQQIGTISTFFCFSTSSSITDRVGYFYMQQTSTIESNSQTTISGTTKYLKVYGDTTDDDLIASYTLLQGTFDTNDYPDVFA